MSGLRRWKRSPVRSAGAPRFPLFAPHHGLAKGNGSVPGAIAVDFDNLPSGFPQGARVPVLPYAVGFVAADEFTDPLVTKEYASPGSRLVPPGSTKIVGVRDLLESHGVAFPPGAYAYVTKDGKLVVRNSEANLRVVDEFLDGR